MALTQAAKMASRHMPVGKVTKMPPKSMSKPMPMPASMGGPKASRRH